jgi:hypothetical protein
METPRRSPLTDSPWFWVLVFAGMALAALLAIGPKYGGRQARLERQYQARERIAARSTDEPQHDYASADNTLIPLWPLALVLSVLVIFAVIMLIRGRRGAGLTQHESPPP